MIWFGPSGNSQKFYQDGFKSSWQMPAWLANMGLNAYEYQCNKGTNIKRQTAEKIGLEAKTAGIRMSIHAPYYINLSSADEQKRKNSIQYILKTLQIAQWMGAERIVIHPGAVGKYTREKAMMLALPILAEAVHQADELGFSEITLCPEVLGKINNLGSLEEVLTMCQLDERMIPCVDFGHVHARSLGGLTSPGDYREVFDKIESKLGLERTRKLHIHFSRVEFTAAGERKHHTMEDTQYGPEFEHLAQVLVERDISPVVICESRDRMAEDAYILKKIYEKYSK
ncbi:MAG: TIM barrel protein [Clostridiaceae bacterium]|jgi:deoxyribonuclease-4|nr:TIM barrel protein [Clostridiaceae bacterium]